jgi:hypothetical protein
MFGPEYRQQDIEMSEFQREFLAVPECYHVCLLGGRGGGKSYALALAALRHTVKHGEHARWLFTRLTYQGCLDFALICRQLFGKVWGDSARYNQTTGIWTFPNGAVGEINQLDSFASYQKFQGRNFTLHLADEIGAYPDDALLNMMRSNLRAGEGISTRVVYAANPGGPGHHIIHRRWVAKAKAFEPFVDASGDAWVVIPSTFRQNPYVDQAEYLRNLEASCAHDQELLRAWRDGDFDINRGAHFAGCLDERKVMIAPWALPLTQTPKRVYTGDGVFLQEADIDKWRFHLTMDYGVAAPTVVYLMATSPGATGPDGRYYPRKSIVILAEWSTSLPGRPNDGSGMVIPLICEHLKSHCREWGVRPTGVCDDACFASTGSGDAASIADEFSKHGVMWRPARKGSRLAGWSIMRRLLADAGSPDRPGLYVVSTARGWWDTVPFLPRDPRHPEDVDTSACDHYADATRYGILNIYNPCPQREF